MHNISRTAFLKISVDKSISVVVPCLHAQTLKIVLRLRVFTWQGQEVEVVLISVTNRITSI